MKSPNLPNKDLWKFYQLFNLLIIHRNPQIYQTNIYEKFMDLWPDPTFFEKFKGIFATATTWEVWSLIAEQPGGKAKNLRKAASS